jgi:hypothetical protein
MRGSTFRDLGATGAYLRRFLIYENSRPISQIKDGWNILVNKDAIHPNSGPY